MNVSLWVAASIPVVALAAVMVSASYVRSWLGRWPVIYVDTVDAPMSDAAVTLAAVATLALRPAILLVPMIAALRASTSARPILGRWTAWLVTAWAVACALITWDPAGFVAWVLD